MVCCRAYMLAASGPHRVLAPKLSKCADKEGDSSINLSQSCDFWMPEMLFFKQVQIYYKGGWLRGSGQDTGKLLQQQGLCPPSHSPHVVSGMPLPLANTWQ